MELQLAILLFVAILNDPNGNLEYFENRLSNRVLFFSLNSSYTDLLVQGSFVLLFILVFVDSNTQIYSLIPILNSSHPISHSLISEAHLSNCLDF